MFKPLPWITLPTIARLCPGTKEVQVNYNVVQPCPLRLLQNGQPLFKQRPYDIGQRFTLARPNEINTGCVHG